MVKVTGTIVARQLRNPYSEPKLESNKGIDSTSFHVLCSDDGTCAVAMETRRSVGKLLYSYSYAVITLSVDF